MAKRMLIDATHPEETRVVVLAGNRLEDFDFETSTKKQIKGNIYLAKVTRVEPSLQAAFIEYGGNRHGFLAFSEIHPDYYQIPVADRERLLAEMAKIERGENGGGREEGRRNRRGRPERAGRGAAASKSASDAAEGQDALPPPDGEAGEAMSAASEEGAAEGAAETVQTESAGAGRQARYESDAEADGDHEERHSNRDDGENGGDGGDSQSRENRDSNVEVLGGDDNDELTRRRQRLLRNYKIQEVIKRRQILLVQVVKEERGNKGAALTTYLSLAGRYCVLMPNTARGGGVSRKITSVPDRKRLKSMIDELQLPEGMGLIVRTAGSERTKTEIKRDCDYLIRLWDSIRETTLSSTAPCLIHAEADLIKRSIRDLYARDIEEVLVEGEEQYKAAKDFMKMLMPSHAKRVQRYKDPGGQPLFQRFLVESQLDAMHSPVVPLKSGGSIVINQTEALVAIDVNSGRATRERHIEDTALKTNLEAADEVARQLRLRDLAGLIVIDFIDMEQGGHNHQVERRLKDAMRLDRARIQIGRISAFGLLELSRQRLRPSLVEASTAICPHCAGTGHIRSVESTSLHVLRAIEEEAAKRRASELTVTVPTIVALYILNHKRTTLAEIEARHETRIFLAHDDVLIPPNHRIERTKIRDPQALAAEPRPVQAALPPPVVSVEDDEVEDGEDEVEVKAPRASEPRSAESRPEQQGESAEGGRRRRRRRRRRGGDRPLANGEQMPVEQGEAVDAVDAVEGGGQVVAIALDAPMPVPVPAPEDGAAAEGDDEPELPGVAGEAGGEDADGAKRRRRGRRGGRRRGRREDGEGPQPGVGGEAEEPQQQMTPPRPAPLPRPAPVPLMASPYQPTSVADEVMSVFERLETEAEAPRPAPPAPVIVATPVAPAPPAAEIVPEPDAPAPAVEPAVVPIAQDAEPVRAPDPVVADAAAEPALAADPNPPVQVIGADVAELPKRGGWWRRK
jgi:ribonuclease E